MRIDRDGTEPPGIDSVVGSEGLINSQVFCRLLPLRLPLEEERDGFSVKLL